MDLKQLEKKAWETQFRDGSADVGIGILIAVATFFRFNPDISYYYWIWMLLPVPFVVLIKKYITTPRIGQVKFCKERIRIVLVAAGLFIIWSLVAYFRDFPRLFLYAFLAAISVILTGTNIQDNPVGMAAWYLTSIVMIAIGIYLLVKFIKKYPLPSMEVTA
jgi:hypothetical protein